MHDLYPAPHPEAGFERVDGRLLVASLDDVLHRFIEDDETPSYTAERILELSDGTRTVAQIAAQIGQEFEGAAPEAVAADVRSFVAGLVEGHVLVLHHHPCPASPATAGSGTDPRT